MDKLKPCPFCGGDPKFVEVTGGWCAIVCNRCDATTKCFIISSDYAAKDRAVKAWNRRVNDASVRHGHWIKDKFLSDEVNNCGKCSQCGELIGWVRDSAEILLRLRRSDGWRECQ